MPRLRRARPAKAGALRSSRVFSAKLSLGKARRRRKWAEGSIAVVVSISQHFCVGVLERTRYSKATSVRRRFHMNNGVRTDALVLPLRISQSQTVVVLFSLPHPLTNYGRLTWSQQEQCGYWCVCCFP